MEKAEAMLPPDVFLRCQGREGRKEGWEEGGRREGGGREGRRREEGGRRGGGRERRGGGEREEGGRCDTQDQYMETARQLTLYFSR